MSSAPWRAQYQKASFRGCVFNVSSAELSTGQRGPLHEYPLRDEPFFEPMGLKAPEYSVEGYIIGPDYFAARDNLIAKLAQEGPGELVHPYYGTRRVVARSFRVRETSEEGGIARFSIDFVETPAKPVQPAAVPDAAGKLASSAVATRTATGVEFLAKYNPGTLLAGPSNALRQAARAADTALGKIRMGEQALASMRKRVDTLIDSVSALVTEPEDILSEYIDLFDAFDSSDAVLEIHDFDPGVRPPATTPSRVQEQTNFDAVQRLVKRLAVTRAAEIAATETFTSYEEAIAHREVIADLLDEQAEDAADDTYPVLLQLRSDLIKAVPGEDGDLPRLLSITPAATVPSLVLAFRLYGNLDREADLIARNQVSHPGFVVGGEALEVLSND